MRLTFWGVRGSIPVPGPATVRYGGNTTCVAVRADDGGLIVLDAGTGIFQLARSIAPEMPLAAHIFISHTHWDHIQGLPFFIPLFVAGNTVHIYGAADPITRRDIREVLARQMEYAYFPVRENELRASIGYTTLRERQTVAIGDALVTPLVMGHPAINFGYRIDCNDKCLVFTGDHEWPYNIYQPDDAEWEEFEAMVREKRRSIIDFFRGADALIIDSAYTPEEYAQRIGWGHGTFDSSIIVAREAGVARVWFTHHEPTRSDDELERVFKEALERNGVGDGDPEFGLAREGLSVEV